jgi:hypothetical protein
MIVSERREPTTVNVPSVSVAEPIDADSIRRGSNASIIATAAECAQFFTAFLFQPNMRNIHFSPELPIQPMTYNSTIAQANARSHQRATSPQL